MNWAAEHEIPAAQKVSHAHVDYEHPSKHPSKRCEVCRNFISVAGGKPRCRTVVNPIRPEDWCVRFAPKKEQEK
ncbi:MAG: hypothetical protein ACRD2O_00030 [Terriglobia bacterium]